MNRRDFWITFLFVSGFALAYLEGLAIEYLNTLYFPDSWYPHQAIVWMVVFGIIHSMLLIHWFAGGRFNWNWRKESKRK